MPPARAARQKGENKMTEVRDEARPESAGLSRRRVLRTGAGLGAAVLGGPALALAGGRSASAHGTLHWHNQIAGFPLHYENLDTGVIGGQQSFGFEPVTYNWLRMWMEYYYLNTPGNFVRPGRIHTNGAHVDESVGMHPLGRAMDISGIMMTNASTGAPFYAFNGRHDTWWNSPIMPEIRRNYWGTVASLNIFFKYVLHYHSNSIHVNHVHADNQASYNTYSSWGGSTQQIKFVQAVCNYIYGLGTVIDGSYGNTTRAHASTVLAHSGMPGTIETSQAHWHRFCWAGFRRGYNLGY
jgi:hypothetical protein